ncbi:hypothetical protein [Arcobacter roscoffensis]|uniref:Solute-binding protein family 3/N-terminal domain-containing protein n=1 Tax=Arcobacter roscoffensis TaxID=2961520 RepID=A0ABY5E2F7_9BACT|nr:hypothetical protein [Arcobacter roscoffensis]UTJ05278.1 hypothetical protein NJU99_08345 [Arcobacter roscoffensis]
MKYFFIFISLFFTISNINASNITLDMLIEENVLKDYKNFTEDKNPLKIKNFSHTSSRRSVVEIVLFQQALYLGGNYKVNLNFIKSPTYLRELQQLKQGKAITTATSIWSHDLKELKKHVYISKALIRNNEFEAGLYTISSNKKALSAKSLKDIQSLKAVSNKYWIPDWKTLYKLKPKKLIHVIKWKYMTRMVSIQRADFLLAPFQSKEDLSFQTENIVFVPIPNLKVGLEGTRHFAISKAHPKAKEIFKALNKGIEILRKEGLITKAYKQSGFFNKKVHNWKKLN